MERNETVMRRCDGREVFRLENSWSLSRAASSFGAGGRDFTYQHGVYAPELELLSTCQLFVCGEICDSLASRVIIQLNYLANIYPGQSITLNVMSPGGSVSAGLAIIDACRTISSPVTTIAYGMCASMGSVIVACAGNKGKRFATKRATLMIHQPSNSFGGKSSDVFAMADFAKKSRSVLDTILAEATGRTVQEIHEATEVDKYFDAEEAVAFGLVDEVLHESSETESIHE